MTSKSSQIFLIFSKSLDSWTKQTWQNCRNTWWREVLYEPPQFMCHNIFFPIVNTRNMCQHWCYFFLIFLIFNTPRLAQTRVMVYFSSYMIEKCFRCIQSMKIFKARYYLVTLLIRVAHVSICVVYPSTPPRCFDKFSKEKTQAKLFIAQ